ncbi:MAG: translesion error-prone DNA polymerase V autoproteolytic subunit [Bacteroidia bacterium]|nr:translesion error-prone DNA polymerase V autoproteolytic subunit [Bacteroidia bacterium]
MKRTKKSAEHELFRPETSENIRLPLYSAAISAGFPSPADDYIEQKLDLNNLLIRHPSATYFVRAKGNSMINAGIHDGDILIVDRSLTPAGNSIVIAVVDGDLTVKRIRKENNKLFLVPENIDYHEMEITEGMDFRLWGVVTNVIHKL